MQARQQDPKGPDLPTKYEKVSEEKFGKAPEKSLEMHQKNPSKCGTLKLSLSTHPNLKGHTSGGPLPHKGAKVVIPTTAHFSKRAPLYPYGTILRLPKVPCYACGGIQ